MTLVTVGPNRYHSGNGLGNPPISAEKINLTSTAEL